MPSVETVIHVSVMYTLINKSYTKELLFYLDGSTVFLYASLRIASKMKASVLTSRTEQ